MIDQRTGGFDGPLETVVDWSVFHPPQTIPPPPSVNVNGFLAIIDWTVPNTSNLSGIIDWTPRRHVTPVRPSILPPRPKFSVTVSDLLGQLAEMVQENASAYGGVDWSTGLWSRTEIIHYINTVSRDFILRTQLMKVITAVYSVAGQRLYNDPEFTMQMDRVAFNNRPLYRTNRFMLDRNNRRWRLISGMPTEYHQDQLPTKTFEVDRAPTVGMSGVGYTTIGNRGGLRFMMANSELVIDAVIQAGSTTLFSATGPFEMSDVGSTIYVAGAGPGGTGLLALIATFNSANLVQLNIPAVTGVVAARAAFGTPYSAQFVGTGSNGGLYRYSYGTPAITGVLPQDETHIGTIRQMFSGVLNFQIVATRLPEALSAQSQLLAAPDICVPYIKYGVLKKMLMKEGEGQDLPRARYCESRYKKGIALFRRLMSAAHDQITEQVGATRP